MLRRVGLLTLAAVIALLGADPAGAFDRPRLRGAPSIELGYGISDPSMEELNQEFAGVGLTELNVGFVSLRRAEGSIKRYENGGILLTFLGADLGGKAEAGELDPEFWRAGLRWNTGLGYRVRGSHIILFHGTGLHVNHLKLPSGAYAHADSAAEIDAAARADAVMLGYFDDEFTFGTNTTAGMLLQFGPIIGLEATYERAIAMRRILVWKWAMSETIEHVCLGLIDEFVEKILDRRPAAAPIVSFLLKNGLSYAAYELRRDEMNYPFESAPPLFTDSYKIGLRFTF
jgi:hypothetical protein